MKQLPYLTRPLFFLLFLGALLLLGSVWAIGSQAQEPTPEALLAQLEAETGGHLYASTSRVTGVYSMLRATDGRLLAADNSAAEPPVRAAAFLDSYGRLLGIRNPAEELRLLRVEQDDMGLSHVRLDQLYQGVPVFAAQVIVHMNGQGITAVSGLFVPGIELDTTPTLSAAASATIARNVLVKEAEDETLTAENSALYVYNTGLILGENGRNALAYAVEVRGDTTAEQVWIDAHSGVLLNRIPLRQEGLYRVVYSPEYDPANPDMFVVREEGDPPTLLPPYDNLYDFSGQVYNFFWNAFDRDSYDSYGAVMRTVYLINDACPNAYWNGQATNYCPGFDLDDVVSHEWGHAYTQYTHNLIYQWQPGALNESYSDIWGETIDLHNGEDGIGGSNNSQPYPTGQRWLMGEDLPVAQQILLRNMWDPETHASPAKVSSANYVCSTGDAGGVHTNSGVPNHAYAMLVDGQTYNGQTVSGIGFIKAAHIYWRAASVYQGPASDFPFHADALEASCEDLIGVNLTDFQTGLPSGQMITAADCQEVADAMLAVEMRQEPAQCNFQPMLDPDTPAMCSNVQDIFVEDWQTGLDGWTLNSEAGTPPAGDAWPNFNWTLTNTLPSPHSGSAVFATNPIIGTCAPGGDISGHFTMDSPEITLPSPLTNPELRFEHWVATEANWDGGNLKVSINGAAFVMVPAEAYTFNPPNTTLNDAVVDANTNPLAGQDAWSGSNGGSLEGSWGTTVVDLTALGVTSGDTLQFQWDFGMDGCNGLVGWYVDQVHVFSCDSSATATPTSTATVGPTATSTPTRTPGPPPTNTPAPTATPTNTPLPLPVERLLLPVIIYD